MLWTNPAYRFIIELRQRKMWQQKLGYITDVENSRFNNQAYTCWGGKKGIKFATSGGFLVFLADFPTSIDKLQFCVIIRFR